MSYTRAAVFTCFSASALYSLYHLLRPSAPARPRREPARVREGDLVAILVDIRARVAQLAEEVQDAMRLFRTRARSRAPEDVEALEDQARAEVQAAVAEAEAAVLRERRLARAEYEYAAAYYTLTARSAAVLEARAALRRCVGRYFVTKSSLLGIMRASHELRASQVREDLASAWEVGLIKSPQQVQEMFLAPAFQATISSALERFFVEETGMSASELAALSKSPSFLEVRAARCAAKGGLCTFPPPHSSCTTQYSMALLLLAPPPSPFFRAGRCLPGGPGEGHKRGQ